MNNQNRLYIVKVGDTLSKIAQTHGISVAELQKINKLANPDLVLVGQRIYLKHPPPAGIRTLFLDRDRNPIQGLRYRFDIDGQHTHGITGSNGCTNAMFAESFQSRIEIWVERLDGRWKRITSVMPSQDNKLVTLISAHIAVEARTEAHPIAADNKTVDTKLRDKPIFNGAAKPSSLHANVKPGMKVISTTTSTGVLPLAVVTGEVPELEDFLDPYIGGDLQIHDIESGAKELKCEAGLIYAIAKQESAHSSFFSHGNRMLPTILFERHQFKQRTQPKGSATSPFESSHPDVCGPAYRRALKTKQGWIDSRTKSAIPESEVYGRGGIFQYKHLLKAYRLAAEPALESCSWGKFQVMGSNYRAAGFSDVRSFAKAMSRSEAEHMKAFLQFAKQKKLLLEGLRTRDFTKIAEGHNGRAWRTINPEYAANLKKFYEEYTSKT